jgi:hypothetical protein
MLHAIYLGRKAGVTNRKELNPTVNWIYAECLRDWWKVNKKRREE